MRAKLPRLIATGCLKATCMAGGLLLVLTAFSNTAWAFDPVPEIDPGSMASAVTLFIGGVLMLTGSRRKR